MPIGAFAGSFDLPLLLVILFVLFFLGLVYHLHQEDKREGYPLVSNRTTKSGGRVEVVGFPPLPKPKTFIQPHGRPPVTVPRKEAPEAFDGVASAPGPSMPYVPAGPAMGARIGPASWADRRDEPDLSHDNQPVFMPMREAPDFRVTKGDADPRGFAVLGLDKRVAGRVIDIWVDRSEHFAKFLEVALDPEIVGRETSFGTPASRDRPTQRQVQGEEVVAVVVTDQIVDTVAGPVEVTEVDVVTAPTAPAAPGHANTAAGDWNDGGPTPAGHVLVPMEFVAVNGRERTVRSGVITAAQFGGIPQRKADLIITAWEEERIRAYFGGGYLYALPGRTEPLI